MPFELTNAPATFQCLIHEICRPYLTKFILVFLDDIGKSWESHLEHLRISFQLLQDHTLFVKKSKCVFGQNQVKYLGHIISKVGVAGGPSRLKAITHWLIPNSIKALRGFLGLAGYYRKFIPGFRKIINPLIVLTKKDNFKWSDLATAAFNELKHAMLSPQVLALPDFS